MRKCLSCQVVYESSNDTCPACHRAIDKLSGISIHAPEFMHQGGGFKAGYFEYLARSEEKNFWFRGRNRVIIAMLRKYAGAFRRYLEIGCGTGFVAAGVSAAFPQAKIQGSEIFIAGLEFAARRLPQATFMQMDARHIPFQDEFDVVAAFDVLEHIREDSQVLSQMHQALLPGGILIITVPQHDWLWSASDEYACHVRRYSARDIESAVRAAGFDIVRSTSFVSTLLPAMLVSRLMHRKSNAETYDPQAEFNLPSWLNRLFEGLLYLELLLIRAGLDFPLGGSRLVVAKKRQS